MKVQLQAIAWLVYLFVLTLSSVVCETLNYNSDPSDYDCKEDADCNELVRVGQNKCGICIETKTKNAKCLYPFPYMFKLNDKKCIKPNQCNLTCQNGGYCTQVTPKNLVYTPGCQCTGQYYGDECQYLAQTNSHVINYVSWIFKGFIPVGGLTILRLTGSHTTGLPDYHSYQFFLSTEEGYTATEPGSNNVYKGCYYKSATCSAFLLPVRFPYKLYNHSNKTKFINFKDEVIGYFSSLTFVVEYNSKIIYEMSYPVIVYYKEETLKCVPIIDLKNCSPNQSRPTIYSKHSVINLISKVTYVTDGKYISKSVLNENCAKSANFIWKMWKFVNTRETDRPLFQNYTKHKWHFDPFSLGVGEYKVMLEVQNVQVRDMSINTRCCYIKVKYLPLIAVIDGGSDRMINKEKGLKLSASRSRDPNLPNSQQSGLYVQWSCIRIHPLADIDPICTPQTKEYNEIYYIKPEFLTYSAVYNFTLLLFSRTYINCKDDNCPKPTYAYTRIEVGNKSSISIECLQNCADKVVPGQQLFLKVITESYKISNTSGFKWTFHKLFEKDEKPIDSIKVEGLPPFMLLVGEDSFETGEDYTITVRVIPQGGYAKYSFITDEEEHKGNCTVDPMSGIKGRTLFDIVCPERGDSEFLYEFYDNKEDDLEKKTMYSGRMLGSSKTGRLIGVQLIKGVVTVFIINSRGFNIKQKFKINLTNWDVTEEVMFEIKRNLSETLILYKDEPKALRTISLIPNIIPAEISKKQTLIYLLTMMHSISTDRLSKIKLTISTLYNVLTDLNKSCQFELENDVIVHALSLIKKQAGALKRYLSRREQSVFLTPTKTKQVIQQVLECFHVILHCKRSDTFPIELDNISLQELVTLKMCSNYVEEIFHHIMNALSFVQIPGKPSTKISSEKDHIIVWVLANDQDYPFTNYLKNDIPVIISSRLLQVIEHKRNSNVITLQIATIDGNVFWWLKSDVKSNMVSASIAIRIEEQDSSITKLRHVHSLRYPLDVKIKTEEKITNVRVNGSVNQVNSKWNQEFLDLKVKIHRFDIMPRSIMTIMFIYPTTNGSLRVTLLENFRPDYKIMVTESIIVSEHSPNCPHHYHEYDDSRYLYMGILPSPDVPINKSVEYAFEVKTTLCQFWNRGSWRSEGCLIGHEPKDNEVLCQCDHLSIFAAAFPVPPQRIDPFADAKLFLTILDNPLVVSLIIAMLVIYLLLFVWLFYKDKKDSVRKTVIYLEDNFPLDKYSYLLAVFTSPRFNAGTTAQVGITVLGSEANSRAHILRSSDRKVLKTGSDDWFLMYCPEHLGTVTGIHIWQDNAGRSPSWFCSEIYIYDLRDKTETKFVVDQWLALHYMKMNNNFTEALLRPENEEDILTIKRDFLDNFVLGIRDSHMVLSIFYRHPRSQVSSVQRLSIIMLYIMVAMLCSIMFYKPTDELIGVDDNRYSVGMREVIVSIESLIISVLVTIIVLISFRKSYKWKHDFQNSFGGLLESAKYNQQKKGTFYNTFVRYVTNTLKHPPLTPVRLRDSPPIVIRRTKWFVISWVICLTAIIVSAYFVMLFGLKLGSVNSKKWLTSVLLTLSEDTLITGPVRILILSILLSLAFQLLIDVRIHHIDIQDEKLALSEWGIDDMEHLLYTRSQQIYKPITHDERAEIVRKEQLRSYWWSLLDFLVAAVFVFVVCNVIFLLWITHFYMNSHIQTMFTERKVKTLHSIPFNKVINTTYFEDYLANNFLHTLYVTRWYNKERFNNDESKYWAADFSNKLLGRPKIRQLRVRPVSCGNIVMKNYLCAPRWKEEYEDTDPYAKKWKPGLHVDMDRENSPWLYTEKSTPFMIALVRLYGTSGKLYPNGGYAVTLGPKRQDVDQMLEELRWKKWLDGKTRAVFLEFTMFNVNYGLFIQVTLLVEFEVSGIVLLGSQATSLDNNFELNLWECVFVSLIVFYILRSLYLVNFLGFLKYLAGGFSNICQLIVIVFGLLAVFLFCTHFYTTSLFAERFQTSQIDEYFDYDSFSICFVLLQMTLAFLLCVAILRLITSIRGGIYLQIHFHTFRISLSWMCWTLFVILGIILVLKQLTFLLNIFTFYETNDVIVSHNSMKHLYCADIENTNLIILMILKMICICFINTTFIVLFVYFIRLSRSYRFDSLEQFNFVTFLISRIYGEKYTIRRTIFKYSTVNYVHKIVT